MVKGVHTLINIQKTTFTEHMSITTNMTSYACQRVDTRHAGNCFVPISIRPIFIFLLLKLCQLTWLLTGWKKILYFRRLPWGLRPVAFAISATWLIRHWPSSPPSSSSHHLQNDSCCRSCMIYLRILKSRSRSKQNKICMVAHPICGTMAQRRLKQTKRTHNRTWTDG